MRSFGSDNHAGVHPDILSAIIKANADHVIAYGDDPYTERAVQKFKEHFGSNIEVHFVFNGTAANVLALSALVNSFHAVFCAELAHIQVDECGAPEKFTGCKLFPLPAQDGKLFVDEIKMNIIGVGVQHSVQPKVISIAQTTELGTVYSPAEIKALADFAHSQSMFLHVDGARIANAAAALNLSLKELTADVGVDVLSFGGTKNGLMCGEAIVFFNPEIAKNFKYIRKQGMQLASKMRFFSAQFEALLSNELWLQNAKHANRMASLLAGEVEKIPGVKISRPVMANAVFAYLPPAAILKLIEKHFFYLWDEKTSEVRWMTSFDTTEDDVQVFVTGIKDAFSRSHSQSILSG